MCSVGIGKERGVALSGWDRWFSGQKMKLKEKKKKEIRQGSANVIWLPPSLLRRGRGRRGMWHGHGKVGNHTCSKKRPSKLFSYIYRKRLHLNELHLGLLRTETVHNNLYTNKKWIRLLLLLVLLNKFGSWWQLIIGHPAVVAFNQQIKLTFYIRGHLSQLS